MSTSALSGNGADWRRAVEPYVGPDARRASFQLINTFVPLALCMWAVHVIAPYSVLATLLFTLPIAGLLVRGFIIMHDCSHSSFFANRTLNDTVGYATGMLTLTPFSQWRRDHALHHASSGDLDRRGHGDVPTLTVREYKARSLKGRFTYRLTRHPLTLLLGGPFWLVITQRMRPSANEPGPRHTWSIFSTNVVTAALIALAILLVGWKTFVLAYALPFYFAAMTGVWLFYVQHQFEAAYWTPHKDWNYVEAALMGSSHLKLPRLLQWFTGNIGLHHVHHVQPKIPNYRLEKCHEENALFHQSPVITIKSGIAALSLSLWDEDQQRLVRFRDITP